MLNPLQSTSLFWSLNVRTAGEKRAAGDDDKKKAKGKADETSKTVGSLFKKTRRVALENDAKLS